MTDGAATRQQELLRDLIIAGQHATKAQLETITKAVEAAQADAREARDTAKETAVVIREQNALARVAEVRAEAQTLTAAVRQDMVHGYDNLKKKISGEGGLEGRLEVLEVARTEGKGMARGAKLLFEVIKLIVAASSGALVLKLFGG